MFVRELRLEKYRNYLKRSIELGDGLNVILGLNGSGKTNILEAIYLLSFARSYRSKQLQELISFNEEYFFVECKIFLDDRDQEIAVSYRDSGEKKMIVNGLVKKKTEDFTSHLAIVSFSPDDLKIVKGEPEDRRIFLNDILIQTSKIYTHNRGRYIYAVRQRNSLLKRVREGFGSITELESIEELLVRYGAPIANERRLLIDILGKKAQKIFAGFIPNKELQIEYCPNFFKAAVVDDDLQDRIIAVDGLKENAADKAGEIARAMREAFDRSRSKEIEAGSTSVGPHRDEMLIKAAGRALKQYGSQGEQRTAVLALKLAELEYLEEIRQDKPMLLLDDVLSELDEVRRKALLAKTKAGYQTILTTTNMGYFTDADLIGATMIRTTDV